MTIQRMRISATGHYHLADPNGEFVHYNSHKEVVDLIYDQLDLTQKQLERAQEQIRMLTEALTYVPLPPRGYIMIDRYNLGASGYGNAYLCDSPYGEVVLYDDHKQIVDDLESDIISLKSEINALHAEIRDIEYERRNEYDY